MRGDFIGLTTMQNFIKSNGIARDTYASRGRTPYRPALLKKKKTQLPSQNCRQLYCKLRLRHPVCPHTGLSFFTCFFLFTGILSMVFVRSGQAKTASGKENGVRIVCRRQNALMRSSAKHLFTEGFFHGTMIFCIAMPLFLLIRYAYTVDFQAQDAILCHASFP